MTSFRSMEIVDLQDGFSPNFQEREMSEVKDTYYEALEVVVAHYAIRRFQDVLERHLVGEDFVG